MVLKHGLLCHTGFVHDERSPDREPVWSGVKQASSGGARRGAPLLPESGHEEEEEEEED